MENFNFAVALLWYAVFLFSTICHEAAHAATAHWLGDSTAYEGGQVTLDPIPHMRREPFGTILFPLISFLIGGWMIGWASTPYDFHWALRFPKRSALMSLAGPVTNLALVAVSVLAIVIGLHSGHFQVPEQIGYSSLIVAREPGMLNGFATILSVFFSLNLLLFVFNLLPLPPLDGSGVLAFFMSDRLAEKYFLFTQYSGMRNVTLILSWLIISKIFSPIYYTAVMLLLSVVR